MWNVRTISDIEIPAHSIVIIPTKKMGKCALNEPCMYEMQVNEILVMQTLQLCYLLYI